MTHSLLLRTRPLQHILCLLTILLACLVGPTGAPSLAAQAWTSFGTEDGLLRSSVRVLEPARNGGMWAGTFGGLNHWDGERWAMFSAGNGLARGAITAIVEQGGDVWAGSWGGGLSVLRGEHWLTYFAGESPLPGNWISALAGDADGLWIATYGAGLARVRNGTWTSFTRAGTDLPSDWLTCLLPDGVGGVWVGTERAGLAHLDAGGQWRRLTLPLDASSTAHVTALALQDGELWVGTNDGLAILALASGRWRALGTEAGLPHKSVTSLVGSADGMWIGTDRGLGLGQNGRVQAYTVADGLPQNAISAVAVDARGRLWVGTPGKGVAVRGQVAKPQVVRAPVVLVHGWRGPDDDTLEESEFWHLARWLREDGFTPYYATGISPENTLAANAERLRVVIGQARRETGALAVYLIGFSMGGLNSRAYLESTLYQGDVLRVFTLGSPHRGEYLWQTLLLWEYLAWRADPSALELLPLHIDLFNRTHGRAPNVPYTLVAGDARADDLPTLFQELPPGDGLVSMWSALGVEGDGVDQRVTEDLHAWARETILADIPSLLYPRSTYDAHIRPHLFGVGSVPGAGSAGGSGTSRPVELDPRTGLRSGDVGPGQTVTVPLPVDVAERARLLVRWKDTPLEVSLRDPRGRLVEQDGTGGDDRAEYLELGFADFAGYVLTDTMPGEWSLVLKNESRSSAEYVAYATFVSPIRLKLDTGLDWYGPGEEVLISAEITAPPGGVIVDHVEAEIFSPVRQREVIRLQRVASAGGVNSMLFEGRYRAPAQGGYYVVLARATGRRGGVALERGEQAVFGVRGDGASLVASPTLAAQWTASAELAGLEAAVTLDVRRPGQYLCSVSLLDGAGEKVVALAHAAHLEAGEQELRIVIPWAAVATRSQAGPYRLGEVLLLDVTGAGVLLDSATGGEGGTLIASVRTD